MDLSFIQESLIISVSIYGALANVFMTLTPEHKKEPSELFFYVAMRLLVGSFSGIMAWALTKTLKLDIYTSLIVTGMSGWMGSKFLETLQKWVEKILNSGGK